MGEIIYSKYANERALQFALRTDIVRQENGELVVHKTPLCQEAKAHVRNIYTIGEALNEQYAKSRFRFNSAQITDTGVELEFINEITLESVADKLLYAGKVDEVEDLIFQVIEELYKTGDNQGFCKTADFVDVFGEVDLATDLPCVKISDIDMLLGNIMQGEKWTVIDYEWSFDFPIPVQFIAYRLLHYYLYASSTRGILRERNLMQKAGIDAEREAVYYRMERHFQDVYVLRETSKKHYTPLRDLYHEIALGSADVRTIYARAKVLAQTSAEQKDLVLALDNSIQRVQENKLLKAELEAKKEQISAMENTKVWKAYRKYREIKEK